MTPDERLREAISYGDVSCTVNDVPIDGITFVKYDANPSVGSIPISKMECEGSFEIPRRDAQRLWSWVERTSYGSNYWWKRAMWMQGRAKRRAVKLVGASK